MKTTLFVLVSAILSASISFAHAPVGDYQTKTILADQSFLDALGIPILHRHVRTGLGVAVITPAMEQKISAGAHLLRKCAGFEALPNTRSTVGIMTELDSLADIIEKDSNYMRSPLKRVTVEPKQELKDAIAEVDAANLKEWVTWLSSFENRYNKAKDSNKHIAPMVERLQAVMKDSKWSYKIDLIDHKSTTQKSIRLRLEGTDLASEVIVLGGHLDSINQGMFGGTNGVAPGADDNASGSSNLVEALRIISQKEPTKRSIEFFWYAGEESGLLGSAEIAKTYKANAANVKAVLQLDMTLFPGEGKFVLGSTQDYTTAWLKDYLLDLNNTYLNVKIVDDKCGYACSDHASWYKNGFATLMPFEATMDTMNRAIHTPKDVISTTSDFDHSAVFSKIAVLFALDLGNAAIN